ncbi:hypothetical protein R80B4_02055 [Fibrobacteres bacterium R8-0-B4]
MPFLPEPSVEAAVTTTVPFFLEVNRPVFSLTVASAVSLTDHATALIDAVVGNTFAVNCTERRPLTESPATADVTLMLSTYVPVIPPSASVIVAVSAV